MQAIIKRMVSASLATVVAGVLLATAGAGMAWALNVDCTINFAPLCVGANSRDSLQGEDVNDGVQGRRDVIKGRRGSDGAEGNGGDDERIDGESGNDKVNGGAGDDGIGPTNDGDLEGGPGNNTVLGGAGDEIDANDSLPGDVERILGGAGSDTIEAVDGEVDNIDCGPGNDTIVPDVGIDVVAGNC